MTGDDGDRKKPVCCSGCGKELSGGVLSSLMDESRVRWTIAPHVGELLDAATVGGTLTDVGKLFASIGKARGVATEVMVERITTSDDGAITMHLLIARMESVKERKARRAARQASSQP